MKQRLEYDKKLLTLQEIVEVLDDNFDGHLMEYKMINNLLKYGNEDEVADDMVCNISDHVAKHTRKQAERVGLDYFLVVNINCPLRCKWCHNQESWTVEGMFKDDKGVEPSGDGRIFVIENADRTGLLVNLWLPGAELNQTGRMSLKKPKNYKNIGIVYPNSLDISTNGETDWNLNGKAL